MNKLITKQGAKLLAVAAGFVLFSFTASAQNLINTGKVNNAGTGTIRFNDNNGEFDNAAAVNLITNDGVFLMMGTDNQFTGTNALAQDDAHRVPGMVSYAATAGTQNIYAGYYTDLDMADAGIKNFGANSFFVGRDYTTAGGNRNYVTSSFTYDGTVAQNVAEENGTNGGGYYDLTFTNAGLKTIAEGDAIATNTTTIDATTVGGGLVVDGTVPSSFTSTNSGTFTQVAGAGDFSVNAGGVVNIQGAANTIGANTTVNSGSINFGDGTNASATTVTGALNLTGATALLAANDQSTLNVNGAFTNSDQARTNMTYDAGSTIDYQDNATNIITTASTNPYGAFIISKSTGAISPTNSGGGEDDINIATSFAMSGGGGNNLDMIASTGGMVNLTSGTAGNVTYANNEEVVGIFRRSHNIVTGQDYVFNNAQTKANFTTKSTDNAANYFEFFVNPDGQTQYYDNTRDIKRQITIDYNHDTWVGAITAGYQDTDVDEDNAWVASYNENQIRFREGKADGTLDEKVSTGAGNPYARTNAGAGSLGYVTLPGMTSTNADVDGNADDGFFADATAPHNELILRAGPAIWYSVAGGRWSNPATWDEGTEPPTDAEVVVRHNVHAGFVRAVDGYNTTEAFPGAMATKITIQSPNATFPNPTLMFGRDGTYPGVDFATSTAAVDGITDPGRIIVESVTTENAPADLSAGGLDVSAATNYVAGLVVWENSQITASESLINNGCLNIGGVLGIGQP